MARLFQQLVGHQAQVEKLLKAVQQNHLSHAMLFVGPEGVGKKAVAMALTQALLCPEDSKACGYCPSCLRVEKNSHENLLVIEPEKHQIKIDQAHQVLEFLGLRSLGQNRVIVMDHAEGLNAAAANSLLKILEEPPEGTYFLLIAPSAYHVLPTVRSRCQVLGFAGLTTQQLAKKMPAEDWMLAGSLGSLSKLQSLLDPQEKVLRAQFLRWLHLFLHEPVGYMDGDWRELIRQRENGLRIAEYLSFFLRDVVLLQAGQKDEFIFADQMDLLREFAAQPRSLILAMVHSALQLQSKILQNRDTQLLMEDFWITHRQKISEGKSHVVRAD